MTQRAPIEVYNSVSGGAFFEGLLVAWAREGRALVRCHSLGEEAYRAKRGAMGRWWLRWKMYGAYAGRCWRTARRHADAAPVRVVATNPFFAPALVQRAAAGRGATINLLYDLYPEALIHAGVLQENSWLARRCAAVTRAALRDCDATVFLGERLQRHAEARYGRARRAVVIPVGADGAPFRSFPPQPLPRSQPVRVLYAGQMGRMHDIGALLGLLESGIPNGVEFAFHATGAGYGNLKRRLSKAPARCRWGDALDDAAWRQALLESPVALVTMSAGAEDVVMPSKTYAALVAGQAVMAVCPRDSDLAALVRDNACGWVVDPGDVAGLRRALEEVGSDRNGLLRKRQAAFEAGHRRFDTAVVAREWLRLFEELEGTLEHPAAVAH